MCSEQCVHIRRRLKGTAGAEEHVGSAESMHNGSRLRTDFTPSVSGGPNGTETFGTTNDMYNCTTLELLAYWTNISIQENGGKKEKKMKLLHTHD
jgi:hypothetical protein